MSTNEELIGRADVDDLEAILAVTNTDVDGRSTRCRTTPTPSSRGTTRRARPALNRLYEKASLSGTARPTCPGTPRSTRRRWSWPTPPPTCRWVGRWHRPVGHRRLALRHGRRRWIGVGVERNWTPLSQFMHNEQGALICAAKIVETVPWIDAKYRDPPRSWTRPATSRSSPGTSTTSCRATTRSTPT